MQPARYGQVRSDVPAWGMQRKQSDPSGSCRHRMDSVLLLFLGGAGACEILVERRCHDERMIRNTRASLSPPENWHFLLEPRWGSTHLPLAKPAEPQIFTRRR